MRLPDFLVIGALKCGTSSLHTNLGAHPELFTSPKIKEINYFAGTKGDGRVVRVWASNLEEYAAFFEDAPPESKVGEIAPAYLATQSAPQMIRATIPDVKLIVVLRQPIERAWSHYLMSVRAGTRSLDADSFFADTTRPYLQRSFYAPSLQRYYDLFPAQQIKPVLFERLKGEPEVVLKELYSFLGVDESFVPPVEIRNRGFVPRSKFLERFIRVPLMQKLRAALPPSLRSLGRKLRAMNSRPAPGVPSSVRERARGMFDDDMTQVEKMTGLDLSAWRSRDKGQDQR